MREPPADDPLRDALTGLPNRVLFLDRVQRALERSKRRPGDLFAVLFLDLDGFEALNGRLGRAAADELLRALAERLQQSLRGADTVARLRGDEFALLVEEMEGPEDATRAAGRVLADASAPFTLGGGEVSTTGSLGLTLGPRAYERAEDLLRDAEAAMLRAKGQGTGRQQVFDRSLQDRTAERLQLEAELRGALETGELRLHYQPVVALESGRVEGLEALVRWAHPERGLLLPADFLDVAEEAGLLVRLGRWTVREACRTLGDWKRAGLTRPGLGVGVNVSTRQFAHEALPPAVEEAVESAGLGRGELWLEITEEALADGVRAAEVAARLASAGVALHLQRFGGERSSLGALQRVRLGGVKIDPSLVARVEEAGHGQELVRTITLLARGLGLAAVAHAVETPGQLAALRALGCPRAQGRHLSPPLDAEAVLRLLLSGGVLAGA